jgi:putative transposase
VLIFEYKLDGNKQQYEAIEEAIRVTQFIRNKCLRLWMDVRGTDRNDLQCACSSLSKDFAFAACLNSQARQAAADRAWFAIARFYEKCALKKKGLHKGKCGYPQFQHDNRSVEYKITGWKLERDGKHITFTDGCGIGTLRMVGTRDVTLFPVKQVKRVRILRRADGYYVQFTVKADRVMQHVPTGAIVGIDMGLNFFYTDSNGNTVENPRFLKKSDKKIKRLHRHLSKTAKKSNNRKRARQKLAKAYLKVQRQREDFARKTASTLITSHDLIAVEDLKIANMVKNHSLAKSMSDASWGRFLQWAHYYAALQGVGITKVAPHFTSQNCSGCGRVVQKALSVRTHVCPHCGLVLDRDHNAARNILAKASTVGQTETATPIAV